MLSKLKTLKECVDIALKAVQYFLYFLTVKNVLIAKEFVSI